MSLKINKQQFKKWIAALDSGEYKQGHCELQNSGGYCCLGVGCKVIIQANLISFTGNGFIDGLQPVDQPAAPKWLINIDEEFNEKTGRSLISLNDSYGFTFPEIATLLELVYIHKILD